MKPKTIQPLEENSGGTSLAVPWLRLKASTAGSVSSIPGQGTKISSAMQQPKQRKHGGKSLTTLDLAMIS